MGIRGGIGIMNTAGNMDTIFACSVVNICFAMLALKESRRLSHALYCCWRYDIVVVGNSVFRNKSFLRLQETASFQLIYTKNCEV